MLRYIAKRLLLMIPILLGVSLIVSSIMEFTPGDPVRRILGAEASVEAVEQLREQLGLNRSFPERYFTYLKNIVTKLDFGTSWRTGKAVFDDIMPRIPVSLTLAVFAILVATLFGVPLGVFSAVKQNTMGDNAMRVLSTVLVAIPGFWFAMMLILLFSLKLDLLPASGVVSWQSYILPVIAVAGPNGCRILRITRSTMLECIREDYVRTAHSKGVPSRTVVYRHALQNALLPVITTIGQAFGVILGGAIIVESVFSMPGLGSLIILSIRSKDTPMILACVLLLAVFFSLVMLVVDIVNAKIDPRIKAKYAKK